MDLPPAVVVHGLLHARVALAPGLPVLLLSAPDAASFAGAGWWRAMLAAARAPTPDALDCGDAPGRALEAISCGCRLLILAPSPSFASVAARGAVVLPTRPPALDLARNGADRRLLAWLQGDRGAGIG